MNVVQYLVEIKPGHDPVARLGIGVRDFLAREFHEVRPVGLILGEGVRLTDDAMRRYGLARVQGECRPGCALIVGVGDDEMPGLRCGR